MNTSLRLAFAVCLVLMSSGCGDNDPGARGGAGGSGGGTGGAPGGSGGQATGMGGSGNGDSGQGEAPPPSTSYFPFAVGNTWEYDVTETGIPTYRKVHQIVRAQLVEGTGPNKAVMAYRVETRKSGGVGAADATLSWQARAGSRVVRYREVSCIAGSLQLDPAGNVSSCTYDVEDYWDPPRMRIDERPMNADIAVGVSWPETYTEFKNRYTYGADPNAPTISPSMFMQTDNWRVQEVGTTVTTKAGTFSPCIVLQKTSRTEMAKAYTFCRGVGKVKEEGASQTELLVSHKLN